MRSHKFRLQSAHFPTLACYQLWFGNIVLLLLDINMFDLIWFDKQSFIYCSLVHCKRNKSDVPIKRGDSAERKHQIVERLKRFRHLSILPQKNVIALRNEVLHWYHVPERNTSEQPLTEECEREEGAVCGETERGGCLRRSGGEYVRMSIARSCHLKTTLLDLALLGTSESSCQ